MPIRIFCRWISIALRSISATFLLIGAASAAEPAIAEPVDFDISKQPLSSALSEFARQSDREIFYTSDLVNGKQANKVTGTYEPDDALDLLLADSGLDYSVTSNDTFLISDKRGDSDSKNLSPRPVLMAQNQTSTPQTQTSQTTERNESENVSVEIEEIIVTGTNIRGVQNTASPVLSFGREAIDLSGLSTTQEFLQAIPQNFGGSQNESTLIAGAGGQNIAFGSTVNLRGLGADSTLTLVNGRRTSPGGFVGNFVDVSTIPLSAIKRIEIVTDGASAVYGADAVAGVVNILLRDDYEQAETSLRYGFADGDADEILASQVVGGHWNSGQLLLTYEYYDRSSLAASARAYSETSDLTGFGGDNFNTLNASPGNVLSPVAAGIPDNQDGTNLTEADLLLGQLNSQNQRLQTDVLPSKRRHSLAVFLKQELSARSEVFLEGGYTSRKTSSRDTAQESILPLSVPESNAYRQLNGLYSGQGPISISYSFLNDIGPRTYDTDADFLNAVGGITLDIGERWQAEFSASYASQEDQGLTSNIVDSGALAGALASSDLSTAFNPFAANGNTPRSVLDSIRSTLTSNGDTEVSSLNLKADGVVMSLPGGEIRAAIGGEYRDENFSAIFRDTVGGSTANLSTFAEGERDVFAVFGEALIPLIGDVNRRTGIARLEVSAAIRHEDYSDFGSTTNPKVGLLWAPHSDLIVRSTYGSSFKAPLLFELNTPPQGVILALPGFLDPQSDDGSTILFGLTGGNQDLQPEEADTWTVGFDARPSFLPGVTAEFTYFDIEFEDRIAQIPSAIAPFTQPEIYGVVLTRDPTPAQIDAAIAAVGGNVLEVSGPVSSAEAIVDARFKNLSRFEVRGFDFDLSYNFNTRLGDFYVAYNGSYLTDFKQAFTSTAPLVETVDTINQPVDFRSRGTISWTRESLTLAAFINHLDGYTDNVSVLERDVGSLTTIDFRLAYRAGDVHSGIFEDTVIAVNARNLFDTDPPFVNNSNGFAFDPNNYDPMGRFISLQVTKAW